MNTKTVSNRSRENLISAMRIEAFAFAKFKLFAKQARENGHHELAALFEQTSDEKYLSHFAREATLLGMLGSDEQDLNHAIAEESLETGTYYKKYAEQARSDGDLEVAQHFDALCHDEAVHRLKFSEALIRLRTHDMALTKLHAGRLSATRRKASDSVACMPGGIP